MNTVKKYYECITNGRKFSNVRMIHCKTQLEPVTTNSTLGSRTENRIRDLANLQKI